MPLAQARFVAKYGKVLTPLQLDFLAFYLLQAMKPKSQKPNPSPQDQEWAKFFDEMNAVLERHLFGIFLKAVKEHDSKRIKEIAQTVWYFKDKIQDDSGTGQDPVRMVVLNLRPVVELLKSPMPIKVAVDFVEQSTGLKLPGKEHSYPDFRKRCKELGFPLESREIRKK